MYLCSSPEWYVIIPAVLVILIPRVCPSLLLLRLLLWLLLLPPGLCAVSRYMSWLQAFIAGRYLGANLSPLLECRIGLLIMLKACKLACWKPC
ncbi:hypothetical protein BGX38DRAFT_619961 [Terfezia claveryi]|nr:hypothetical protein BGX38DRAFT_619961 [Terfezia claveryi]